MSRGGSPVWAFVLGGLFALGGAWLIINGLTCQSAVNLVPGSTANSGLSGVCQSYEWGGIALLAIGIVIPLVAVLASRRSGAGSGRRVGARR